MPQNLVILFQHPEGRRLIEQHCRRVGLAVGDLERLVEEVIEKDHMQRRRGLWQAFDEILDVSVPPKGDDG
ncbi:hypothetical protein JCM13664_02510 [Methylothermus subterraneus]